MNRFQLTLIYYVLQVVLTLYTLEAVFIFYTPTAFLNQRELREILNIFNVPWNSIRYLSLQREKWLILQMILKKFPVIYYCDFTRIARIHKNRRIYSNNIKCLHSDVEKFYVINIRRGRAASGVRVTLKRNFLGCAGKKKGWETLA